MRGGYMQKLVGVALATTISLCATAASPPSSSCAAWLTWLDDIIRLEELRAGVAEGLETAEGNDFYALVDADIEWREQILRLMQRPPVEKKE